MRLSKDQLLSGLKYPLAYVRDSAAAYFEETADPLVAAHCFSAIDKFGWEHAFRYLSISKMPVNHESVGWLVQQLAREDWRLAEGSRNVIFEMFSRAPLDAILPYYDRIAESVRIETVPGAIDFTWQLQQRLRIWELSAERAWGELIEQCETAAKYSDAGSRYPDQQLKLCALLVDRIANVAKGFEPRITEFLNFQDIPDVGPISWIVNSMIQLAGRIKMESAIDALMDLFRKDWDDFNESIFRSLVQIGTPAVFEILENRYVDEPWHARLFLIGGMLHVHEDYAIDCALNVLSMESDDFLRGQLGLALASHFDDRCHTVAMQIRDEDHDDPERYEIIERLSAFYRIGNMENAELDEWESRIQSFRDFSGMLNQEMVFPLAKTGLTEQALSSSVKSNGTTIMRSVTGIGRNDMCPCGSGKKYNKCCLQH